jgi:murein L,D-transpeptidase YcbB/YkuD
MLAALAPAWGQDAAPPETAPPSAAAPAGAPPAAEAPPTATPPLAPEAAAFRDALAREAAALPDAERAAIVGFFAARDFTPFWTAEGGRRGLELVAALEAAPAQALPAGRYDAPALALMLEPTGTEPSERREVAATRAYLRLAADLSAGVLKPSAINPDIAWQPQRPVPAELLAALDARPLPEVLRGFEPTDPDYRRLVEEKARLEAELQAASWGPEVADGPTLHPGDVGPRVTELRGRLARLGYLVPAGEPNPAFDAPLAEAVERFQRDYGLAPDGVVGKMTLAAVNAPVATRLAQVVVNLERMRWMDGDLGDRHLYVNIPDFSVRLVDGGRTVWESRVVVGKARVTETPEFSGVVSYMVVNPTWHIPDSIAIRDYLPKLQRDPMVLKRQGIRLLTRGGTEINPNLVDFTQYTPENFPFRIKQRPSDSNALGNVKFMFPNRFSIYLHDTPHREYFALDTRALSNGCIRVEKPKELAEILLAGQTPDPAAAFDGWVATGKEKHVTLERTMPVHLVYRTVWVEEDGTLRYRGDIYGRDEAVFEALEAAGVMLPAAQG